MRAQLVGRREDWPPVRADQCWAACQAATSCCHLLNGQRSWPGAQRRPSEPAVRLVVTPREACACLATRSPLPRSLALSRWRPRPRQQQATHSQVTLRPSLPACSRAWAATLQGTCCSEIEWENLPTTPCSPPPSTQPMILTVRH